jgi:hypothetical protein
VEMYVITNGVGWCSHYLAAVVEGVAEGVISESVTVTTLRLGPSPAVSLLRHASTTAAVTLGLQVEDSMITGPGSAEHELVKFNRRLSELLSLKWAKRRMRELESCQ